MSKDEFPDDETLKRTTVRSLKIIDEATKKIPVRKQCQQSSNMQMKNIEIRYASKEDSEILSNVIATVIQNIPYYNDLAKINEILKFQSKALQVKISEDKYSVILATADSQIVGFCLSRFDDYVIWLEWFGVVDNYRGKGMATLLLKELNKTVVPRKSHKIWCDCRTENKASIHILTSHGYTQVATIPNHWYKQDFIIWEKVF